MTITIILLVLSFAALIYRANLLVDGASSLASRFGVSNLIIGLTVVAFGTSLPDLTINTFNSIKGLNDTVPGNDIGLYNNPMLHQGDAAMHIGVIKNKYQLVVQLYMPRIAKLLSNPNEDGIVNRMRIITFNLTL